MGLVGEGQGTASGTREDTPPNWGCSRVPSLIGIDPSELVPVLCLASPKDKPPPTGRGSRRGEVGTGCLLSLPSLGGIY